MNAADIKKLVVAPEIPLKVAMSRIGSTDTRMLFVADGDSRLIGSISDGDIRRAVLNNVKFERPVKEIMHRSPKVVLSSDKDFREKAIAYIVEEKIYAIPVLDSSARIENILLWYDFFKAHPHEYKSPDKFSSRIVIMAGGRGERLDPFTKILPKPLIPIGDKPVVEKIMDSFYKYGFENFILTLNYKKDMVKMYFGENKMPYNVRWVEEDDYLGTAGSLDLLRKDLLETFFVCNCDTILEHDIKNILNWHKSQKAHLTVVGCHREVVIPYGAIELNDGYLKDIKERPVYDLMINIGTYVMEPEVLDFIRPKEKINMNELISRVMKKWKVAVYPLCGGWFDLGQWKEYQDSIYRLENGKNK